jgi:hypothetical protein
LAPLIFRALTSQQTGLAVLRLEVLLSWSIGIDLA